MIKKLAFFILLTFSLNSIADQLYYVDKERGWFWREEPPVLEVPTEPDPQPIPDAPKTETTKVEGPKPFTAKWFKQNMDDLRDAAIDNPTKENVGAYYYAQRVALDKAEKFADVAMTTVQADPFLDANAKSPMSVAGKNIAERDSNVATQNTLSQIAQHSGIWFFFRSDCSFCHAQAPILAALRHKYNFKIMPISLDGRPLSADFPDYQVDRGQSEAMGVTSTPTLMLATPPKGLAMLGEGFLPLDELESRIMNQAVETGAITIDQKNATRISKKNLVPDDLGRDIAASDLKSPQDIKTYILKAMKEKK